MARSSAIITEAKESSKEKQYIKACPYIEVMTVLLTGAGDGKTAGAIVFQEICQISLLEARAEIKDEDGQGTKCTSAMRHTKKAKIMDEQWPNLKGHSLHMEGATD